MPYFTDWFKTSSLLTGLGEMAATGSQWVGWQWAVYLGEQLCSAAKLEPLKYLVVPITVTANELTGCQVFGRLLEKLDDKLAHLKPKQANEPLSVFNEDWKSGTKFLKTGIASTGAGITFYFVDNAVLAACTGAGFGLPATLALRCLAVMVADRIVFHLGCEVFDLATLKTCGKKALPNAQLAINAGTAAIGYELGSSLAEFICSASNLQNPWVKSAIASPFIFLGTALSPPLSYVEKKLFWQCYPSKEGVTVESELSDSHLKSITIS